MLISILINNYNYGRFLKECINSVLNQTYQDFEIIIVDDGSTDNSHQILDCYSTIDKRIKVIKKDNGGQLSAFNAGFLASKGEIIFFLDSDDIYYENYLSFACSFYDKNKNIDALYVSMQMFGQNNSIIGGIEKDLGYSICRAVYGGDIGFCYATSSQSVRRSVLEKFLPLTLEYDWRICADHTIVVGTSLAGGRKYFSDKILIGYRAHNNNAFLGNSDKFYKGAENQYKFGLKNNRLIRTLTEHLKIEIDENFLYKEYRLCPSIDLKTLTDYKNILSILDITFLKRIKISRRMKKRYKHMSSKS